MGKGLRMLFQDAKGLRSKVVISSFILGSIILFPFRRVFGQEKCQKLRFPFLFGDVLVENNDGIFWCRKKKDDVGLVSPLHEKGLRDIFNLKGGVFVDVGAHIGKYSIMMGRRMKGRVISIEPDPDNFAILRKNVELNALENVILFNVAVSNREGSRKFFVAKGFNTGHNTFYPEKRDEFREVVIECNRLDKILASLGVSVIDLLKVDVEGAEDEVFDGMGQYLFETKRIIYEDLTGKATPFLKRRGFRIVDTEYPEYKLAYV